MDCRTFLSYVSAGEAYTDEEVNEMLTYLKEHG